MTLGIHTTSAREKQSFRGKVTCISSIPVPQSKRNIGFLKKPLVKRQQRTQDGQRNKKMNKNKNKNKKKSGNKFIFGASKM